MISNSKQDVDIEGYEKHRNLVLKLKTEFRQTRTINFWKIRKPFLSAKCFNYEQNLLQESGKKS